MPLAHTTFVVISSAKQHFVEYFIYLFYIFAKDFSTHLTKRRKTELHFPSYTEQFL